MTGAATMAFSRGLSLYQQHVDEQMRESFELLGHTWHLADGVFAPSASTVTEVFTGWLPFPRGGAFLEVGCGAGVTAVMAALAGCREVLALDISGAAVDNTRRNAALHGVDSVVEVLHSDLFDQVPQGRTFDLIFWNSNFVEPPAGFSNTSDLHHAFFDPGYAAHRRYLTEASRWLAPGGIVMLGFGDIGNWSLLKAMCDELGLQIVELRRQDGRPTVPVVFQLLAIRPAVGAP